MKPKDLIDIDGDRYCRSCISKFYSKNKEKDCMIAYIKNCLGFIGIMKTDKTAVAFTQAHRITSISWNCMIRVDLKEAMEFIDNNNGIIVNQEEYDNARKKMLLMKLKQGF